VGRVPRSPYVLAALVSAALPAARPVQISVLGADEDVDEAVVEDAEGLHWVVRAPRTATAGATLEREVALLAALDGGPARRLPFAVPVVAGSAALPEGGRAVVVPRSPGEPVEPSTLRPGPGLAVSLGRAIAAIHELSPTVVEEAGLPIYEAAEYRERRLSELDRAAATGKVPPRLLQRWETALEDVGRWHFSPTVVHGDLAGEHVLAVEGSVSAVVGWGEAMVADPADDLAWLAAGAPADALAVVLESYARARAASPDRDVAFRARLAGELALARWLLHGVLTEDEEVVADAARMLTDLDRATDAGDLQDEL
jgi:aminoglycoside phosphotransferase (APT) family kinase protein